LSDLKLLQEKLGYQFTNSQFLQQALTLPGSGSGVSYERLEFLGDLVLDLVVGLKIFRQFPEAGESFLSNLKASYVNRHFLYNVAAKLHLQKFLSISTGSPFLLADVLEALIGAIFLDSGLKAATSFIDRFIMNKKMQPLVDYKNLVATVVRTAYRKEVSYQIKKCSGLPHQPRFVVRAWIEGKRNVGNGAGPSRKEAEIMAARDLLKKLLTSRNSSVKTIARKIRKKFLSPS